jgi:hypothetical protein
LPAQDRINRASSSVTLNDIVCIGNIVLLGRQDRQVSKRMAGNLAESRNLAVDIVFVHRVAGRFHPAPQGQATLQSGMT